MNYNTKRVEDTRRSKKGKEGKSEKGKLHKGLGRKLPEGNSASSAANAIGVGGLDIGKHSAGSSKPTTRRTEKQRPGRQIWTIGERDPEKLRVRLPWKSAPSSPSRL